MQTTVNAEELIETVPPTDDILRRLADAARARDILRKQLRISKQADRDFPGRKKAEVPA